VYVKEALKPSNKRPEIRTKQRERSRDIRGVLTSKNKLQLAANIDVHNQEKEVIGES
jgi:hypothetical protein